LKHWAKPVWCAGDFGSTAPPLPALQSEAFFYHVRTQYALHENDTTPKPTAAPTRRDRASRRGRSVATVLFVTAVSALTALWTWQIVEQLVAHGSGAAPAQCRPGVRALIDAMRRARRAAAEETGGEKQALARFRAALAPAWRARPDLDAACAGDPAASQALRKIDSLRYAEEHAVRYEAAELARRRRQVLAVEASLFAQKRPPTPAAAASGRGQWQ